MLDSKFRKFVQPGFDFVGRGFVKVGATPNQLTIAAFIIGIAAAVLVALGFNYYSLAALLLSGFIDVIDGTVARLKNIQTKKGTFLDMIFDRMVEGFFIIGLAIAYPSHYISYIAFLVLVVFNFSTFLMAGSLVKNTGEKSMHYEPGIVERTETIIFFGFILVFPNQLFYILNAFNLLILITGIIRFKKVYTLLSE